jgi:predicted metalloprotease with PDZ domain
MSHLVEEYVRNLHTILEKGDIEGECYNNALSIKNLVEKEHNSGRISRFDLDVLGSISRGFSYFEVAQSLNADRKRVADSFKKTCSKVAFLLGGDFTDAGFMYNEASKYVENEKDEEIVEHFFGVK